MNIILTKNQTIRYLLSEADYLRSRIIHKAYYARHNKYLAKYESKITKSAQEFFLKQRKRVLPKIKREYPSFIRNKSYQKISPIEVNGEDKFIIKAIEDDFVYFISSIVDWEEEERLLSDWAEIINDPFAEATQETLLDVRSFIDFDLEKPEVRDLLREHHIEFSHEVSDTTRGHIAYQLSRGFKEGESIKQIAGNLEEYLQRDARHRSVLIARTEIIGRSNQGSFYAMQMSGRVKGKQWTIADYERARKSHREANMQIRPVNEPFNVGKSLLMYPGDTSLGASAEEVIQCRCVVIPYSYYEL